MDVIIYSTPKCKYCAEAKQYFEDMDIDYLEIDVAKDLEKREEMIKLSGQMAVPVIVINGNIFVGFNEQEIQDEIDRLKLEDETLFFEREDRSE